MTFNTREDLARGLREAGYATDPDLCFHASTDPILAMVNASNKLVHSDLTAIIANSPTTWQAALSFMMKK